MRFFFCIVRLVVAMKVYVDVVFFINFMFDLLLLLAVGLERHTLPSFRRFLLGALVGAVSIVFLFLPLTTVTLFFLKFGISLLMLLTTFGFHNKQYFFANFKSLYGSSIILGGLMYFLNVQFSYRHSGLVFFHDGASINLIIIMIVSPILFIKYYRERSKIKHKLQLLHQVKITYQGQEFVVQGCLDTGNTIKDPYKKRPVLILDSQVFQPKMEEAVLVPFKTVSKGGLLRCVVADKLLIDERVVDRNKYLIGSSEETINLQGASCILPSCFIEEDES